MQALSIQEMDVSSIIPYIKNPRKNKQAIDLVARSIKEFGFNQPIVVDGNNVIIVGHTRWKAAKKLEMKTVPVYVANLSDEKAKAYRIADNRTNEEADWDWDKLVDELRGMEDPSLSMFSSEELDELLIEDDANDDEIPDVPEVVTTRTGDVWQLGEHILVCGDSTDADVYNKLLGDDVINLCFSSPPYNINSGFYNSYEDNRGSDEYVEFNLAVLENIKEHLKGFIFWNISYNKNCRWEFISVVYKMITELKLEFMELIVWDKKHAIPIQSKELLTRRYEDVFLFGNEAEVHRDLELWVISRNNKSVWFNKKTNKKITNYWEVSSNGSQLDNHKACYPVELPMKGIKLMTEKDDIVCDPFCGSGTTIIACEKSERKCRGIELDPVYVDVSIMRWEQFSGKKATLNGETFDAVKLSRQGE